MRKRLPDDPQAGAEVGGRRTLDGSVDVRRQLMLAGAWRISDLMEMDHRSPRMLGALRQIHDAARQVIGGNLARRALDRDGLERLRASLLRQVDQARELQERLVAARAGEAVRDELHELLGFLEEMLGQVARKLGSRH